MQNQCTRDVYDYWHLVRRGRPAPHRFDIDPIEIGRHLRFVFIIERPTPELFQFRLAGTFVCDCFGGELRGRSFIDLWAAAERERVAGLLHAVTGDACGVVIGATGHATGMDRAVPLELLMFPAVSGSGACDRILGTLAALQPVNWMGHRGMRPLDIGHAWLAWQGSTAASPMEKRLSPLSDDHE